MSAKLGLVLCLARNRRRPEAPVRAAAERRPPGRGRSGEKTRSLPTLLKLIVFRQKLTEVASTQASYAAAKKSTMAAFPKKPEAPQEWVTSEAVAVNGLDLLGLRIPVERIGQRLLRAVTTISPTIRYISLRAWISRRYALARLPNSWRRLCYGSAGKFERLWLDLAVYPKTIGLVGAEEGLLKLQKSRGDITLEPLVLAH